MRILFDSKNEYHKSPFGCLLQDEKCVIRVQIPVHCKVTLVSLIIKREDGFEMKVPFLLEKSESGYESYTGEFSLYAKGLYFYYFHICTEEGEFNLYKQGNQTNIEEGQMWQVTCIDKNYDTPDSFKGRVMYQIFPDRFYKFGEVNADDKLKPYYLHSNLNDIPVYKPDENGKIINNDFFGGNLNGIAEKLPYLKKLGVGIIYLNPVFMAFSNHRYDTADYKKIDPLLGDESDFKNLCSKAHKNGMKIILDGVFSHTGSNSVYFDKDGVFGNGAYTNPDSPYKNWFMFSEYPCQYTSWWGIETLPCVDEMNEDYIDFIINGEDSVIAHWLTLGADGFRLDVADELPDEFIALFKSKLKKIKPDALLIGEVWEDASNKISYGKRRKYFSESELDSVMNYPFCGAIIDFMTKRINGEEFADKIMTVVENYPKPVLSCLMNMLSTHDTCRVLTLISGAGEAMSRDDRASFNLSGEMLMDALALEKIAAILQFTLPGNPCIYYGDEIGMQGFEDPFNRAYFKWDDKNEDLLSFYTELSKIKNTDSAVNTGDIYILEAEQDYIKFARQKAEDITYVEISLNSVLPEKENTLISVNYKNMSAAVYK